MIRASLLLLLTVFGNALVYGSSCSASVTQALRTQWNDGTADFYLYDISVTNTGSQPVAVNVGIQTPSSGPTIDVTQYWNAIGLASTDETDHTNIFAIFDSSAQATQHSYFVAPGQSYTGSGYVSKGSTTSITGYPSCASESSSAASSSSESASSASSSSPVSSSSSSASQDSGCSVSVAFSSDVIQNTNNQWEDADYHYSQYGLVFTNTGDQVVKTAQFTMNYTPSFGSISQAWNVEQTEDQTYGGDLTATLFNLQPGQTFSGAGFIFKVAKTTLASSPPGHYYYPYALDEYYTQC